MRAGRLCMMFLMALTKRLTATSVQTARGAIVALAAVCGSTMVAGCEAAPKQSSKTIVLGKARPAGKPAPAMPGVNVPAIKVDTVGYPGAWRKVAIWNVEPKNPVVKDAAGKVVLQ